MFVSKQHCSFSRELLQLATFIITKRLCPNAIQLADSTCVAFSSSVVFDLQTVKVVTYPPSHQHASMRELFTLTTIAALTVGGITVLFRWGE